MAKRRFKTSKGKVVEFETGRGRNSGRGNRNPAKPASAEEPSPKAGGEEGRARGGGGEGEGWERKGGYDPERDAAATLETGRPGPEEGRPEEAPGDAGEGDRGPGEEAAGGEGREAERHEAPGQEGAAGEAVPRWVGYRQAHPEDEPAPISSMDTALGELARFVYFIPYAAGLGNQWPLLDPEARMMGRALGGAVKALPGKSKQNAVKVLSRWLPWVSLITTSYIITMPRVMQTVRGGRNDNPPAAGPEGADRTGGRPRPTPNGPGDGLPTWEDYRRHVR